ncbi:DUF3558 family protein [Pseudonocardia spinosispora]|uniref:DUF3558 family protein n=1 Tax=Pseudonocardia spinosispora TaxID=103441 RepID=UPI0004088429|nr:DUF3558 family protein [Pseudonocardia spinosispora]
MTVGECAMRGWASAVAGLTIALAGCGASVPSTSPPEPVAAPAQVNPCALLSTAQRTTLGLGMGSQQPDDRDAGLVSCSWTNMPIAANEPSIDYTARLVDGPAVTSGEVARPSEDQRTHCTYQVELSPSRSLVVGYGNIPGDVPGINHQLACQQAQAAATAMTATYRAAPR